MSFGVRSTRGGPLSIRITLTLLLMSAVFLASFGSGGASDAASPPSPDDASTLSNAVAAPVHYETAARPASLTDFAPLPSALPDLPEPTSRSARARDVVAALDDHALFDLIAAADAELDGGPSAGGPGDEEPAIAVAMAATDADLEAQALEELAAADALEREALEDLAASDAEEAHMVAAAPPPADEAPEGGRIVAGEIRRGDSLASALGKRGVRPSIVHLIASELSPIFDFTRARPGQTFKLVLDQGDQVVRFHYRINDDSSVEVKRDAKGMYVARRTEAELEPHVVRMAGVVETSLYDAIRSLGEDGALASNFAQVFASQFDFERNTRSGDEFQVLYERLYRTKRNGQQEYVKPGRVLAARYRSGNQEYEAVRFGASERGKGGYYRTDGTSLERQFLSAPLQYTRITSGYSNARRHPILKVTRPHHGIDYAAPRGTPVWAVADGTVIHKARMGGFGNLVKVRHANGYVSYYSHLQGFARGLHVGQKVSQKQVLGYVGSTGLATGPHTCFRIARNGKYLNPRTIDSTEAEPIRGEQWASFAATRDELLHGLDGGTIVAVQEAL